MFSLIPSHPRIVDIYETMLTSCCIFKVHSIFWSPTIFMRIPIYKFSLLLWESQTDFVILNLIHTSCSDSLSRCHCSVSPVLMKRKDLHLCTLISISWQDWISPCQRLNSKCSVSINWQISTTTVTCTIRQGYYWEKLHLRLSISMSVVLLQLKKETVASMMQWLIMTKLMLRSIHKTKTHDIIHWSIDH